MVFSLRSCGKLIIFFILSLQICPPAFGFDFSDFPKVYRTSYILPIASESKIIFFKYGSWKYENNCSYVGNEKDKNTPLTVKNDDDYFCFYNKQNKFKLKKVKVKVKNYLPKSDEDRKTFELKIPALANEIRGIVPRGYLYKKNNLVFLISPSLKNKDCVVKTCYFYVYKKNDEPSFPEWFSKGLKKEQPASSTRELKFNNQVWKIVETWKPKSNYVLNIENNNLTQKIAELSTFHDSIPELLWAGDLDRDNKMDFIFYLSPNYLVQLYYLFLSSYSQKDQLVGAASCFMDVVDWRFACFDY